MTENHKASLDGQLDFQLNPQNTNATPQGEWRSIIMYYVTVCLNEYIVEIKF